LAPKVNLQSHLNVTREKLCKALSYERFAQKTLMKLTPCYWKTTDYCRLKIMSIVTHLFKKFFAFPLHRSNALKTPVNVIIWLSLTSEWKVKFLGGDSQNVLGKFLRFFVTLGLKILRSSRPKVLFEADIIKG
jgi:hypothetical protein